MLSQFGNDGLPKGPTAVLPQNLNSVWIKKNSAAASIFTLEGAKVMKAITGRISIRSVFSLHAG